MAYRVLNWVNRVIQTDRVKTLASKSLYGYLNHKLGDASDVRFLNYGYQAEKPAMLELEPADEPNRIHINLYYAVAGAVDLKDKTILEVSSGRGGGASFVKRYLKPRCMVGLDRSRRAVLFCTREHKVEGLRFLCGDAQRLPFAFAAFDAVINVEASHDYVKYDWFLSEVQRVLKPGGHFLYTDFRAVDADSTWLERVRNCGLELIEEENISSGVVRGLDQNTERNAGLVRRYCPRILKPLFTQFAGVKGSMVYEHLRTGRNVL